MPITKLNFRPGINKELSRYAGEGGWYDCDKVRFVSGYPQMIGGTVYLDSETFTGTAVALINWETLSGTNLVGIGTIHPYYYLWDSLASPSLTDITPVTSTTTLGANPIATTNGSGTVVITHVAHGLILNDRIRISGATATGGITAAQLNQVFVITVLSVDTYSVTTAGTATSTTNGGGAAVVERVYIDDGSGGGAWSHSVYGEDLILNPRGSGIFYWDASTGTTENAVDLADLGGASGTPTVANYVMVSETERIIIGFGTNPLGSSTQDPMLVRWSDTESLTEWTPAATNSSGDYRLGRGSEIVCAKPAQGETLIWTDAALYSMRFVGAPYTYGFTLIADNISIASPNTAIVINGIAYWMGTDKFYMYDGRVNVLQCDVHSYVFDRASTVRSTFFVGQNEAFSEIWWFYVGDDDVVNNGKINRYVIYNYEEKIWYHGNMARTAWLDSPLKGYPLSTGYDFKLLAQEIEHNDYDQGAGPLEAYIESADFDLGDGDSYVFVSKVIPDMSFVDDIIGPYSSSPTVTMTISPKNFPGEVYGTAYTSTITGPGNPLSSESYTTQCYVRVRGRQAKIRFESDGEDMFWRLGAIRIEVKPDGRKS